MRGVRALVVLLVLGAVAAHPARASDRSAGLAVVEPAGVEQVRVEPEVVDAVSAIAQEVWELEEGVFHACAEADPTSFVCSEYDGSRRIGYQVVGDLSGDGGADLLIVHAMQRPSYRVGATGKIGEYDRRLEARNGADGALLWERSMGLPFQLLAGEFGAAQRPGVMVIFEGGSGARDKALAIGAEGHDLWTASGDFSGSPSLGAFVAGGATDVLIRAFDGRYTVVDGVDGSIEHLWSAPERSLRATSDLDGDGLDDLLFSLVDSTTDDLVERVVGSDDNEVPTVLEARSARGTVLWTRSTLVPFEYTVSVPVDLGAGHADVYAYTGYWPQHTGDDAPPNAMLIDGATGAVRWTGPGGFYPAACCERLLTQRLAVWLTDEAEGIARAAVRYDWMDRAGARTDRVDHAVDAPTGTRYWLRFAERSGDVDGDDRGDYLHAIQFYDEDEDLLAHERAAVSSGDGAPIWRPPLDDVMWGMSWFRLHGPIDGIGGDIVDYEHVEGAPVLTVRDGRSGALVWRSAVPIAPHRYGYVDQGDDLTGDGRDELLMKSSSSEYQSGAFDPIDHDRLFVVSALDGRVLWSIGYDPPGS